MEATSLRFAAAARALTHAARRGGLVAPDFRSPPRRPGRSRTLRRGAGAPLVSVVVHGRPWPSVLSDLVEGIVAVNDLEGPPADQARDHLWAALEDAGALAPEPEAAPTRRTLAPSGRHAA